MFLNPFQFFASDERIKAVRKMIMAVTPEQRKAALNLLLPYQRSDFEGIFRAMDGTFLIFCFSFTVCVIVCPRTYKLSSIEILTV